MSPRARVAAATVAAAIAAASVVVVVAAVQTEHHDPVPVETTTPRKGRPPLALDLGIRTDREAQDLRRGQQLYDAGRLRRAAAIFARYDSLEARVGKVMAAWPDATVDRLNQLAGLHPQSAVVQLHLGLALFWARLAGAEDAWRAALEAQPDTPYAVTAGNLLFPQFARGLPRFVPSESLPPALERLTPSQRLAELERRARAGERLGTFYYGVALQRLGRQRSAARVLGDFAASHPSDSEAQVAAAVSRFDKARPVAAFSRLGPLSRRFPHAATVRFHLGLLLLWSGELRQARRQLELARRAEPGSTPAREAARYLAALVRAAS